MTADDTKELDCPKCGRKGHATASDCGCAGIPLRRYTLAALPSDELRKENARLQRELQRANERIANALIQCRLWEYDSYWEAVRDVVEALEE